jgi:hypothetical protein
MKSSVPKVMKKVQVLRNKGYSIRPEEEELRVKLETLFNALKKPSQFRGRMNDLSATIQMMKEARTKESPSDTGGSFMVIPDESQDGFKLVILLGSSLLSGGFLG